MNAASSLVLWIDEGSSLHDICDIQRSLLLSRFSDNGNEWTAVGVVLVYASWNKGIQHSRNKKSLLTGLANAVTQGLVMGENHQCRSCHVFATSVQVDDSDASLRLCIGDDYSSNTSSDAGKPGKQHLPVPPGVLPCLAIVLQNSSMEHSVLRYVPSIQSTFLVNALRDDSSVLALKTLQATKQTMESLESEYDLPVSYDSCNQALRIFVAGDRSSVGKSSVCLGILGNLLTNLGYEAETLAYIKPATQSESTQLIQLYCEKHGIDCRPVGPLVYYRGFTRAFLAGETSSTEKLLRVCGNAVDRLARGKKVVLIDGVGFPAVGSICGTDNASVARACSYPTNSTDTGGGNRQPLGVVLVGGSGVGSAVDAFNLNATYFEMAEIPVVGAIFNKLSETGFYSLEACRREVTNYFTQNEEQLKRNRKPFGFVPLYPGITGEKGMSHVDDFIRVFGEHVDVPAIVAAATIIKESASSSTPTRTKPNTTTTTNGGPHPPKRRKIEHVAPERGRLPQRTRDEIEKEAIHAGAAPSA